MAMSNGDSIYKAGTVRYLKALNFPDLSQQKQMAVKNKGRPTPDISLEQSSSSRQGTYNRKFNGDMYEKYTWLCGCEATEGLYCFPCLLYGHVEAWTRNGITDLGHISQKLKKHSECGRHIKNSLELAFLGQKSALEQCKTGPLQEREIIKHNAEVAKNHENLTIIIECILFCGSHDIKIHDDDAKAASQIFRDFLQFRDVSRSKGPYESVPNFFGSQLKIQSEIMTSILMVCRDHISAEIIKADYVTAILVHTNDLVDKMQIALIYRFELNGKVHERFWGIIHSGNEYLFGCIKEKLKVIVGENTDKIIAQVLDGAVVPQLCARIQSEFSNANSVDYYAFAPDSIMEQASSQFADARVFFYSLFAIKIFFEESTQRMELLHKVCERTCVPKLKFDGILVKLIYENKGVFLECFDELRKVNVANVETSTKAFNFYILLDDEIFQFWLRFFDQMSHYIEMLKVKLMTDNRTQAFSFFDKCIQKIQYDSAIEMNADDGTEPPAKRSKTSVSEMSIAAPKICEALSAQVRNRYTFRGYLAADKLLQCKLFKEYTKSFPKQDLDEACRAYPMLTKARLQTELSILYEREEIQQLEETLQLHQVLIKRKVDKVFTEVITLIKLVLTTPMHTAEKGRMCTTLSKVKTFLAANGNDDKCVSTMTMLSVERDMINDIEDFNEQILKKFCSITSKQKEYNFMERESNK